MRLSVTPCAEPAAQESNLCKALVQSTYEAEFAQGNSLKAQSAGRDRRADLRRAKLAQRARSTASRALEKSHPKRVTCAEKLHRAIAQSHSHVATCGQHLAARHCAVHLQSCTCAEPSLQILLLIVWSTLVFVGRVVIAVGGPGA